MPIYPAIYSGPARSYKRTSSGAPVTSAKKYITIHNTSNDATAEGEAAYAKVRTDGTSSHYYCDNDSIVQSLNTDWCAGHVGSSQGNTYGISWEITGVNAWPRETWLANVAWGKLAEQIAVDCRQFGIPPRLLTIAEMRAGTAKGFVTHDMCRIAWGGTTHTDPGPGFPMDHLLERVSAVLIGDEMTPAQERDFQFMIWRILALYGLHETMPGGPEQGQPVPLTAAVKGLQEKVAALSAPVPAPVDVAALVAALRPELTAMEARLNARIDAVAVEGRDAVADLGEGGAAKVRADQ